MAYAIGAADFLLYTGTGTIDFDVTTNAQFSCSNLFHCYVRNRIQTNATVTIEYEYTPVPAPVATAPLLLGGLLLRRRRTA